MNSKEVLKLLKKKNLDKREEQILNRYLPEYQVSKMNKYTYGNKWSKVNTIPEISIFAQTKEESEKQLIDLVRFPADWYLYAKEYNIEE